MATRKPRNDLTAAQVRKALDYDPETGIFRWKHNRPGVPPHVQARDGGKIAGTPLRWSAGTKVYISIWFNGRAYKAHRLAWLYMKGEWPGDEVDHRDGDGSNNRFDNLRSGSKSPNQWNRALNRNNTLGHKGITRNGTGFLARVQKDGVRHHLGTFPTIEEAVAARREAAQRLHGEFARER